MTFTAGELAQIVDALRPVIREELARLQSPTLTAEDIAHELGRSTRWLFDRPWMLPGFGESDIPGRPRRWRRESWDAWRVDLAAHEVEWRQLRAQRRAS